MKCPICNEEMQEENKRIKIDHPFSAGRRKYPTKTLMKRVWHCLSCQKYFGAIQKLAEVTLA